MKMKIEQRRDSTTRTPETRATLEAEIRHSVFKSKAKADTLLGKGVMRPLYNPDKPRSVCNHLASILHEIQWPLAVSDEGPQHFKRDDELESCADQSSGLGFRKVCKCLAPIQF